MNDDDLVLFGAQIMFTFIMFLLLHSEVKVTALDKMGEQHLTSPSFRQDMESIHTNTTNFLNTAIIFSGNKYFIRIS
jgi:hypothetical protein